MPEACPTSTTMAEANKKPTSLGFSHEEPPQLAVSSYRTVSIVHSATLLGSIIAGNCLCSGFICLCLWGFSKFEDLSSWEKRGFNTLSLLLIAILGFGIGCLFDQIGVLVRGTLLQRKSHSSKGVCTYCSTSVVQAPMAKCIIYLGCVYIQRHTTIIRLTSYTPGPYSARTYRFDNMGIVPIPPLLSCWPLWSCISRVCIQSRGNLQFYPTTL